MTSERLQQILAAYGASPERWPADERSAAAALLARSTAAQQELEEAAGLDALLDRASMDLPSAALVARVLAAAPPMGARRAPRRWPTLAAVASLAAAAGIALWLVTPGMSPGPLSSGPADRAAAGYAIDDLGTYATATDVLLAPPGLDLLDTVPALGCTTTGGLGCPDADVKRDSMLRTGGSLHA